VIIGLGIYVQDYGAYPPPALIEVISNVMVEPGPGDDIWAVDYFVTNWAVRLQPFVGASVPPGRNFSATSMSDSSGATAYSAITWLGLARGVYACPEYNRVHGLSGGSFWQTYQGTGGGFYQSTYPGAGWVGSYAYNDAGCGAQGLAGYYQGGTALANWRPTRESQVASPSDMLAISDSALMPEGSLARYYGGAVFGLMVLDLNWYFTNDPFHASGNPIDNVMANAALTGQSASDPALRATRQRHAGQWNVGFCDGHVENLRANQVFALTNLSVNRRWNADDQPHIQ